MNSSNIRNKCQFLCRVGDFFQSLQVHVNISKCTTKTLYILKVLKEITRIKKKNEIKIMKQHTKN